MLRFKIPNKPRPLKKAEGRDRGGPQTRIDKLRKLVTALIRHERIEGAIHYVDESRGYTERLIQTAAQNGDKHKPTMELADYWLLEKDLVHKLFKVIVPRYNHYDGPYTRIHRLPNANGIKPMGCIELKGNPWPPIVNSNNVEGTLLNVLLKAARKDREKVYEDVMNNEELTRKEYHFKDNAENHKIKIEQTEPQNT